MTWLLCPDCGFAGGCALLVLLLAAAAGVQAAEVTAKGGAGLHYKYDDNIRSTPVNRIALSGWIVDAFGDISYATPRFAAHANLKLASENYDDVDSDDLLPGVAEPEASDFDSDNQDLTGDIAYDWERNRLSLSGRYWRDSILNTQFTDTGLGGLPQIEGAKRREQLSLGPVWDWALTERQQLESIVQWQTVEYDSRFYTDYDYTSASIAWSYLLNERLHLQVVPYYSLYENDSANKVESTTYGLQAGVVWEYSEKLTLDILLGGTRVETRIDGGYYIFDPENFQIIFVEFQDQDSNGFTGSVKVDYTEEYYGAALDLYSRYSPSADGGLREDTQARVTYYWEPRERLRLDFDARYGWSDDTAGNLNRGREYGEAGVRVGYQFAEEWWLSARYRYRTQEYDRSPDGAGDSNLVSASVSYRLPKEIL